MSWRCPNASAVGAYMLRHWQLELYAHATITARRGAATPGVLWSVTPDCEQRLDRFEGYPVYYQKRSWRQDGHEFFFYVMTPDHCQGNPMHSYVADMRDSYRIWNLPDTDLPTSQQDHLGPVRDLI